MKPGKIASEVSPVEAAKYCEVITQTKNTNRKSSKGSKLYKMALYNLQRNKKKTLIVIISRKHEFAIMQSIGMTNKQLRKMLMFEGIYYVIITTVVSIILSVIGSISLLKSISKEFWFCEYVFTIKPLVIITPCLLIFAILIPIISYKSINKLTIIERLREVE